MTGKPPISSEEPDWSRERRAFGEWNPGKSLLASIRHYQRHRDRPGVLSPFLRPWAVMRHRLWSVISGADIPLNCNIDGGLVLPHPNGIVVHSSAQIGPNCLMFQQVTLGVRDDGRAPVIEGHVDIGAGAKVLGGVRIAAHARIGANAVVLSDVPAGAIAIGVPAKVLVMSIVQEPPRPSG